MNSAIRPAVMVLALVLSLLAGPASGAELLPGQAVYVPCYSQIYHGIRTRPIDLTITLSVRNIDTRRSITLTAVNFHDTAGKLVRRYLDAPVILAPLMTKEFIVGQTDTAGGSGANFIVLWSADPPANPLFVEAVMIGTSGQQGISFTSHGIALAVE
jgi:hypothetical protein